MRASQILRWGAKCLLKLVPHFGVKVHALFGLTEDSFSLCDGGDCRCEVSFQSYSTSNVELGLQNAIWRGGGLCDFSVG